MTIPLLQHFTVLFASSQRVYPFFNTFRVFDVNYITSCTLTYNAKPACRISLKTLHQFRSCTDKKCLQADV